MAGMYLVTDEVSDVSVFCDESELYRTIFGMFDFNWACQNCDLIYEAACLRTEDSLDELFTLGIVIESIDDVDPFVLRAMGYLPSDDESLRIARECDKMALASLRLPC